MDAVAIPLTAWEQIAVIIVFVLFLGGVWAFIRWVLSWSTKQQQEWRQFTVDRDSDWRKWMATQNNQLCKSVDDTSKDVIGEIRNSTTTITQRIDGYDRRVTEAMRTKRARI